MAAAAFVAAAIIVASVVLTFTVAGFVVLGPAQGAATLASMAVWGALTLWLQHCVLVGSCSVLAWLLVVLYALLLILGIIGAAVLGAEERKKRAAP